MYAIYFDGFENEYCTAILKMTHFLKSNNINNTYKVIITTIIIRGNIQPDNPTTRTNPTRTRRVGLSWIIISSRVGFIFLNSNCSVSGSWAKPLN